MENYFPGIPSNVLDDLSNPVSVSVFPNPSQNDVTLLYSLKNFSDVHAEIFDVMGIKVMDLGNHFGVKGRNRFNFSVAKLDEGYYVIRLHSDAGTSLCKLLVTGK